MRAESQQGGFTLVELMIALTLGLLLTAGLATLFIATNRSYRQNDLIAGMQDQGRFAMSTLSRDLAMAGYWGGMLGTAAISPNLLDDDITNDSSTGLAQFTANLDCGADATRRWSFDLSARVEFRNHDAADAISSRWRCLAHVKAGTDAFVLKRVSGQMSGEMPAGQSSVRLRPYGFYLATNSTLGSLIRWGSSETGSGDATDQPALAPKRYYRYVPRIYFIRDFSRKPGDGTPALCRKELCASRYQPDADPELASCGGASASASASAAGYFTECLAEGVEDMQIVWGLDGSGDEDLAADRYTSVPTAAELATQARMAQVHLLLRSRRGDAAYRDEKTYTLGDKAAYTPGAVADAAGTPANQASSSFYRRIFSTTVQLRNP